MRAAQPPHWLSPRGFLCCQLLLKPAWSGDKHPLPVLAFPPSCCLFTTNFVLPFCCSALTAQFLPHIHARGCSWVSSETQTSSPFSTARLRASESISRLSQGLGGVSRLKKIRRKCSHGRKCNASDKAVTKTTYPAFAMLLLLNIHLKPAWRQAGTSTRPTVVCWGYFNHLFVIDYVGHKRRLQGDPPVPKGAYSGVGEGQVVTGQG